MSKVTYINILKRQLTLQFTVQKGNRADFSGFWGLQAEKAKFKSKKKAAQIMLEKEKALDEMRAGVICVYIYICNKYIYIYIYIYIFIYKYMYMYMCMYIHMYTVCDMSHSCVRDSFIRDVTQ